MNLSTVLCAVPALVFLTAAPVTAQDHVTPTAPADYLSKESPFDVEDEDEDVLKAGKKIYKRKCKKCHGTNGDGKGTASEDIEIKPAPLNAPGYLEERKDGQLYWIVESGSEGTEMEGFGPGTDTNLSEEDMWKVITYIRSQFTE